MTKFYYEGIFYQISATIDEWYVNDLPIKLPNGAFLQVSKWFETAPPQPGAFYAVNPTDKYYAAAIALGSL